MKPIITISLAFLTLSCTNAVPKFNRLTPLESIKINGKQTETLTINLLGRPINVSGECDSSTTSVMTAINSQTDWKDASAVFGSNFSQTCKDHKSLTLTIPTDGTGPVSFVAGIGSNQSLRFKARDGDDYSAVSELVIRYVPTASSQIATKILPAQGQLQGSTYKIRYHFGSNVSGRAVGSAYKVEVSQ